MVGTTASAGAFVLRLTVLFAAGATLAAALDPVPVGSVPAGTLKEASQPALPNANSPADSLKEKTSSTAEDKLQTQKENAITAADRCNAKPNDADSALAIKDCCPDTCSIKNNVCCCPGGTLSGCGDGVATQAEKEVALRCKANGQDLAVTHALSDNDCCPGTCSIKNDVCCCPGGTLYPKECGTGAVAVLDSVLKSNNEVDRKCQGGDLAGCEELCQELTGHGLTPYFEGGSPSSWCKGIPSGKAGGWTFNGDTITPIAIPAFAIDLTDHSGTGSLPQGCGFAAAQRDAEIKKAEDGSTSPDYDCTEGSDQPAGVIFAITHKVPDGFADVGAYCRKQCSSSTEETPCTGFVARLHATGGRSCSYFATCDDISKCPVKARTATKDAVTFGPTFDSRLDGKGFTCVRKQAASKKAAGSTCQAPFSTTATDKTRTPWPTEFRDEVCQVDASIAFDKGTVALDAARKVVGVAPGFGMSPAASFPAGLAATHTDIRSGGSGETCDPATSNHLMTENSDGSVTVSASVRPGLANPFCALTSGAPPTADMDCDTLAAIEAAWLSAVAATPASERPALVGSVVRLAFHDAGEFDGRFPKESASFGTDSRPLWEPYGPDGCLTEAGDHAGLIGLVDEMHAILEPIWQSFCDRISRADLWVAAASFALFDADPTGTLRNILPIEFGRVDSCNCDAGEHLRNLATGVLTGDGRMPVASRGIDTIQRVFVDQMGLTLEQATALLGAHSLGGMSPANSGFGVDLALQPVQTPWVKDNTELTSDYFDELISERWDPFRDPSDVPFFPALAGAPPKQVWHDQTMPTPASGVGPKTVMLNADMALAFVTGVESAAFGVADAVTNPVSPVDWCGFDGAFGCGMAGGCCSPAVISGGVTRSKVDQFRAPGTGNAAFLNAFADAFKAMVSVGYGGGSSAFATKLGTLETLFSDGECGGGGGGVSTTTPPTITDPPVGTEECTSCYFGMCPAGYVCERAPGTCGGSGGGTIGVGGGIGIAIAKKHTSLSTASSLALPAFLDKHPGVRGGSCVKVPETCCPIHDPVCGCNGVTYTNDCFRLQNGTRKESNGACGDGGTGVIGIGGFITKAAPAREIDGSRPALETCGGIRGVQCPFGQQCEFDAGSCLVSDSQGTCAATPRICTEEWSPVCDCDGVTHPNDCSRRRSGKSLDHRGQCRAGEHKPIPSCLDHCVSKGSIVTRGALVCSDCCIQRCVDAMVGKAAKADVTGALAAVCETDTVGRFEVVETARFFESTVGNANTMLDQIELLQQRLTALGDGTEKGAPDGTNATTNATTTTDDDGKGCTGDSSNNSDGSTQPASVAYATVVAIAVAAWMQ